MYFASARHASEAAGKRPPVPRAQRAIAKPLRTFARPGGHKSTSGSAGIGMYGLQPSAPADFIRRGFAARTNSRASGGLLVRFWGLGLVVKRAVFLHKRPGFEPHPRDIYVCLSPPSIRESACGGWGVAYPRRRQRCSSESPAHELPVAFSAGDGAPSGSG